MQKFSHPQKKIIKVPFSTLVTHYKDFGPFKQLSHKTQETVNASLNNHIIPAFGKKSVHNITTEDINSFLTDLSCKDKLTDSSSILSSTTQYNIWLHLQRLLAYGEKKHYLGSNPCVFVDRSLIPRPDYATPNIFIANDLNNFLTEIFDQDQNRVISKVKNALITWLILSTGLRCHDIYKLTWNDVDWNNKTINQMVADDITMLLLKQHQVYQNNWLTAHPGTGNPYGWIFISSRISTGVADNPKPNSYYQWLRQFAKRSNLDHISVRSLQKMARVYNLDINSGISYLYNLLGCMGPSYHIKFKN